MEILSWLLDWTSTDYGRMASGFFVLLFTSLVMKINQD